MQLLDHLCLLRIDGDDASSFLQGQLTNDITLSDQQWQFSGYCNPKGRLLALLQLWQFNHAYYVLLDKSISESIIKRLRMYVLRSKVTITELEAYHLYGAQDWLEVTAQLAHKQQPIDYQVTGDSNSMALMMGNQYLVASEKNPIADIEDNKRWRNNNILAGLPSVTHTTSDLFIPQMLNLDMLNGINFKKGCYTGQEIVARMHYLGKLKQRMFLVDIDGDTPTPGTIVYSDQDGQKSIGHIVDAVDNIALAVLRLNALDQSESFYTEPTTTLIVNHQQPYTLPSNEQVD